MRKLFKFISVIGLLFAVVAPAATASAITFISPPDPSAYARLYVNDSKIAYVEYGGSVNLKWESNKMSSCTINNTSVSGKSGQYELQNVTSNIKVTISCITNAGVPYSASGRSRDVSVDIKVMPPTFTYLENYLAQMQSNTNKKINLTSTSVMLDQAQKAHSSDKNDIATSFLQKSINILKQNTKHDDSITESVSHYEDAAIYLAKTLPVRLALAEDGCSVTASGFTGLSLQYGAHEQGLAGDIYLILGATPGSSKILGFQSGISLNDGISTTIPMPSRSGWISYGVVSDSEGLIYAAKTASVNQDCPNVLSR